MDIFTFARTFGLKLNRRSGRFLQRRTVENVGILLDTSVIHEDGNTWKALAGLREKLRRAGFARGNREYKFLITTI